jgi:hypothetical protein
MFHIDEENQTIKVRKDKEVKAMKASKQVKEAKKYLRTPKEQTIIGA